MFGATYKIERLTTSFKIKWIVVSVLCCLVSSGLYAQTDTVKEEVSNDTLFIDDIKYRIQKLNDSVLMIKRIK